MNEEKLFILVDNYAGTTEAGPAPMAQVEQAKKELEDELGIFIWSIQPAPEASPAPIVNLRQRQELKEARASMADLAARNPEILDPRQSDRYIARIVGKCRHCGAETVAEVAPDGDIYDVLNALKYASGQCHMCYGVDELEEGLEPLKEGE